MGRNIRRIFLCFSLFAIMVEAERAIGADFNSAKEFWLAKKFTCKSDAGDFPSKGADGPDACDDGDMTLFNGLLCLAGVEEVDRDGKKQFIGCDAVRKSQGSDGRWWRSP